MNTATLKVTGMHCSSCSMLITMNLDELPGVQSVDCDHATGKTVVKYDTALTDLAEILKTIADAGYAAEVN